MVDLNDIMYSQEDTAAEIRDCFTFLTKLYLDDSAIAHAPATGWSDVKQGLACLGKTAEVLKLLRRIPYLRTTSDASKRTQAAPQCYFADWQALATSARNGSYGDGSILLQLSEPLDYDLPAFMIGLTFGPENKAHMILDTQRGAVHWYECPEPIKEYYQSAAIGDSDPRRPIWNDPYDSDYGEDDEEAEWLACSTSWSIKGFFAMLKDAYIRLYFIPVSHYKIFERGYTHDLSDDLWEALRDIYQRHGWPNLENFEKESCLKDVQNLLRERYPHYE